MKSRLAFARILWFVIVPLWAKSLGAQTDAELITSLNSERFEFATIVAAEKSNDPTVRRAMEDLFDRAADPFLKQQIAVRLVRKKDPSRRFLDFLLQPALEAVRSIVPVVENLDTDGLSIPKSRSKEFLEWCKSQSLDAEQEAGIELAVRPASVMALAASMDPRGAAIFREGLRSKNRGVALNSAYGLALLGQPEDVASIVVLSSQQPPKFGLAYSAVLAAFDRPEAQLEVRKRMIQGSAMEKSYERSLSDRSHGAVRK